MKGIRKLKVKYDCFTISFGFKLYSTMARDNKHARKSASKRSPERASSGSTTRVRLDENDIKRVIGGGDELVLILDCIQDPHNLGAILRTADGAGVKAVIAPKDKSASITETVQRISVGASDSVPFIQVTNLNRAMGFLKEMGYWFVGTSDAKNQNIYDVDLTGKTAVVMGAEGKGMRRLIEDNCDFLVKIPMFGEVPCLNVSVATGVCLYEAVRQRQK